MQSVSLCLLFIMSRFIYYFTKSWCGLYVYLWLHIFYMVIPNSKTMQKRVGRSKVISLKLISDPGVLRCYNTTSGRSRSRTPKAPKGRVKTCFLFRYADMLQKKTNWLMLQKGFKCLYRAQGWFETFTHSFTVYYNFWTIAQFQNSAFSNMIVWNNFKESGNTFDGPNSLFLSFALLTLRFLQELFIWPGKISSR